MGICQRISQHFSIWKLIIKNLVTASRYFSPYAVISDAAVQQLGNSSGCYTWIKASLSVTQSHSTHFNISSYSDCHSTHCGSPVQRHGRRKHKQQPAVSQSSRVCHSTLLSASPILHTSLNCSWQDAVLITIPCVFTDTKGCVLKAAAQTAVLYALALPTVPSVWVVTVMPTLLWSHLPSSKCCLPQGRLFPDSLIGHLPGTLYLTSAVLF